MFRSLCKSLFQSSRIINIGDPKPPFPCSHLFRSISSSSIDDNHSSSGFLVSYLMNSCGLTQKEALSTSRKLNFKTTSNPDSVVTFFEAHGFTKSHVSKLIIKLPLILTYTHKTLKPKLDYFNSKDVSTLEIVKLLTSNPDILRRSLEKHIIPFFDFIKSIVSTDQYTFVVVQRLKFSHVDFKERLMLNTHVLRDEGVPQSNIVKLLIDQPSTLTIESEKFKDIVEEVKRIGFDDPYKTAFLTAIQVTGAMTKSTWEKKLNAYKKWGWSEEQIHGAFMLHPICMMHSDKKISGTMDYLVNQMGISSLLIAKRPVSLNYSLEKRIIPRCSVCQILISKGLIKDRIPVPSIFQMDEKSFVEEKYVIKHEKEAPELLKVWNQTPNQCVLNNPCRANHEPSRAKQVHLLSK